MEEVDLHVNSYTLSELLGFFSIHSNSSEQELANSYSEKKKQAVNISDRHHRVLFETFLNDAFDVVRESLEIPQKEIKLPKRINSTVLPRSATAEDVILNIDSTFRKNKSSTTTDFVIDLPVVLERVKEIEVIASEIPVTTYNFSSSKNNNKFLIVLYKDDSNDVFESYTITIPDGAWYLTEMNEYMTQALNIGNLVYITFNIDGQSGFSQFRFKTDEELVNEDITAPREFNRYQIQNVERTGEFEQSCLYTFGFVESDIAQIITVENTSEYATTTYTGFLEASIVFGVTFENYFYIYVNDFQTSSFNHQIIGIQDNGYIGNNILGMIQINSEVFNRNVSDTSYVKRKYPSNVRLRKLHIKILDKYGNVVDNGNSHTVLLLRVNCEFSPEKYDINV